MNFDIALVILLTAFIQSIFGTGVLLFGTPILLIIGYDFFFVLSVLLPPSILINFLQLKNNISSIDFNFYKKMLMYSLPIVCISLFYYLNFIEVDLNFYVGFFLILFAIKNHFKKINYLFNYITKYDSLYLVIMGTIHGLTNLGGALLAGIVLNNTKKKNSKRSTIALCYLSMSLVQIITLIYSSNINLFLNDKIYIYWILGPIIFLLVESYIFLRLNEKFYKKISDAFLFLIGFILMVKFF